MDPTKKPGVDSGAPEEWDKTKTIQTTRKTKNI